MTVYQTKCILGCWKILWLQTAGPQGRLKSQIEKLILLQQNFYELLFVFIKMGKKLPTLPRFDLVLTEPEMEAAPRVAGEGGGEEITCALCISSHYTLHTSHYTLHTAHCTIHIAHFFTARCISASLHTRKGKVYNAHCAGPSAYYLLKS